MEAWEIVFVMAVVGNLFIAKEELSWFKNLKRPRYFNIFLRLFIVVVIFITSLWEGVLYRALDSVVRGRKSLS